MNIHTIKKATLLVVSSALVIAAMGCNRTDGSATYNQTTAGRNWVKNESVVKHKTPNGRVYLNTESVYEKFECVGKDGSMLKALSPEECMKAGGKVIEKTVVEETSGRRK